MSRLSRFIHFYTDEDEGTPVPSPVEKTIKAAIVHITDALAKPVKRLIAYINPVQDLHGYDHPWAAGDGKNILPVITRGGSTGTVAFTNNNDGSWVVDGSSGGSNAYAPGGFKCISLGVLASGDYVASLHHTDGQLSPILSIRIGKGSDSTHLASGVGSCTFTADGTSEYWFTFRLPPNSTADNERVWLQIEAGFSATSYAPYSNICPISGWTGVNVYRGTEYDPDADPTLQISWQSEAGTVYGGYVNPVTGVLTVNRANIASYDGETINEPWISSMDAYTQGGTPTTGAQVVYPLTTPLTYQLTPQQLTTLLGENNIWHDANGKTEVTYMADGEASDEEADNILLGGAYNRNPDDPDDATNEEALNILLGGSQQ